MKTTDGSSSNGSTGGVIHTQNSSNDLDLDSSNNSTNHKALLKDADLLALKRGHVLRELIETERVYVEEMRAIIQGYCDEMEDNAGYMQQLVPDPLRGKQDVLFGNMREIYDFHAK